MKKEREREEPDWFQPQPGPSPSMHNEDSFYIAASRAYTKRDITAELSFFSKLTWLVLGGDPAVCSHRVEQLTAL